MKWSAAEHLAHDEAPAKRLLMVTGHFDLRMIAINSTGAHLSVRRLTRLEAAELSTRATSVVAINDREQNLLEHELGVGSARPAVSPTCDLLVMSCVRWNDIQWFLVRYECDGEGVV